MSIENENLRDYLLSKASDEVAQQIDLAVLSGDVSESDIEIVEHALIEDCLEGNLLPPDTILFYREFLVSERRRKLFAELAAIRRLAHRAENPGGHSVRDPSLSEVMRRYLSYLNLGSRRLVIAGAAVVIVCLMGFAIVLLIGTPANSDRAALEARYAEISRSETLDPATFGGTVKELLPTRVRGKSPATAKIRIGERGGETLLRLGLPFTPDENASFTFNLVSGGNVVFSITGLKAANREVRVVVPNSVFSKETDEIRLDVSTEGSSPCYFEFKVE